MKLRWLSLLLVLLCWTSAQAEVVSKIAAVVNNEIITTHQLDLKLTEYLASQAQGKIIPTEQMTAMRHQLLDRLIEEELVQQKIKELKLSASDAEINEAITDVQRQNSITKEQLTLALQGQGLSFEAYRAKMRDQILRFKLIGREVQSKIDVTDQEIRDYFRDHIDDYREPPTIQLDHLRIPLPEQAGTLQIESAKQRAQQALDRLRAGETLAAVLADTEGATGGPMGLFKERELSPLIREALAGKQTGSYSEVVDTPTGLMVFHIVGRIAGSIRNFDDAKIEIRQKLTDQDREERFKTWTRELRKNAYVDVRI
ncbi:MAG TPA: SurA N-terminal domain-containing protein [Geothermobacteraceae bacterium]|nr:SurA N-terminal domain-containing protein [Geothermobacteraceae bacterium]